MSDQERSEALKQKKEREDEMPKTRDEKANICYEQMFHGGREMYKKERANKTERKREQKGPASGKQR